MSGHRNSILLEWGFRAVVVALAILWMVYPPKSAEITATGAFAGGKAVTPGLYSTRFGHPPSTSEH